MQRKMPKSKLRTFDGHLVTINAPMIEKTTPPKTRGKSPFVLIYPFFICIKMEIIDITTNASRFIPCAIFCSTPPKIDNSGIKIVPPPIPNPPKTPPKKPIKTFKKNI